MKLSNADMPAMPVIDEDGVLDCDKYKEFAMNPTLAKGLTKREMFAMHVSGHLLESLSLGSFDCERNCLDYEKLASHSVQYADALLAELDKAGGDTE